MLATLVEKPFSQKGWIFEEKYDGVRMLAYKEDGKLSLISRNGINRTDRYHAIAEELVQMREGTFVLDGEIVVFNAQNVSEFQLLQQDNGKAQYVVFDCLFRAGKDLRRKPLAVRRKELEEIVYRGKLVLRANRLAANGVVAFEAAENRGLEGVVGKDSASLYTEGRSKAWLKVKVNQREEFVIGGFTAPEGRRQHFGALLLGAYHAGGLQYVGKVGTGFNDEILGQLHRKLKALVRSSSPFANGMQEKSATFVSPKLVAEIAFTERTKEGKLRHPVYLGLRDDKKAVEVVR